MSTALWITAYVVGFTVAWAAARIAWKELGEHSDKFEIYLPAILPAIVWPATAVLVALWLVIRRFVERR